MPSAHEHQAIHIARQYLEIRGYTVAEIGRDGEQKGYDLTAKKNAENLKIAVKASSKPWNIPDLDATDFDVEKRLLADFLYVVYFDGRKEPRLCIIPRDAIKPEFVIPGETYRLSSRFKNEATLKPFLRAI